MLIVSFWDLCLDNFPVGTFTHQLLKPAEAKSLIDFSASKKLLIGTTGEDLFAPGATSRLKHHDELREVLAKHYDISLELADFITEDVDDNGEPGGFANPLNLYSMDANTQLLLITNTYEFVKSGPDNSEVEGEHFSFGLVVASNSVEFHLFTVVV